MVRLSFPGFGPDLGASSLNSGAARRSRSVRARSDVIPPAQREIQYAEQVGNGLEFQTAPNPDEVWPKKVTLIGRWSCNGEEFPTGLIGRIVDEVSGGVHVWFKNRGVFKFPSSAIKRERGLVSLPQEPARPVYSSRRVLRW